MTSQRISKNLKTRKGCSLKGGVTKDASETKNTIDKAVKKLYLVQHFSKQSLNWLFSMVHKNNLMDIQENLYEKPLRKNPQENLTLGIQIPSKKVVWGAFRRLNTF